MLKFLYLSLFMFLNMVANAQYIKIIYSINDCTICNYNIVNFCNLNLPIHVEINDSVLLKSIPCLEIMDVSYSDFESVSYFTVYDNDSNEILKDRLSALNIEMLNILIKQSLIMIPNDLLHSKISNDYWVAYRGCNLLEIYSSFASQKQMIFDYNDLDLYKKLLKLSNKLDYEDIYSKSIEFFEKNKSFDMPKISVTKLKIIDSEIYTIVVVKVAESYFLGEKYGYGVAIKKKVFIQKLNSIQKTSTFFYVNTEKLNKKGYDFNEYFDFDIVNDKLYFSLIPSVKKLQTIAEFKLDQFEYGEPKILKNVLPNYYVEKKLYANQSDFHLSNGYLMYSVTPHLCAINSSKFKYIDVFDNENVIIDLEFLKMDIKSRVLDIKIVANVLTLLVENDDKIELYSIREFTKKESQPELIGAFYKDSVMSSFFIYDFNNIVCYIDNSSKSLRFVSMKL